MTLTSAKPDEQAMLGLAAREYWLLGCGQQRSEWQAGHRCQGGRSRQKVTSCWHCLTFITLKWSPLFDCHAIAYVNLIARKTDNLGRSTRSTGSCNAPIFWSG
jgi:hypothetical protein